MSKFKGGSTKVTIDRAAEQEGITERQSYYVACGSLEQ